MSLCWSDVRLQIHLLIILSINCLIVLFLKSCRSLIVWYSSHSEMKPQLTSMMWIVSRRKFISVCTEMLQVQDVFGLA